MDNRPPEVMEALGHPAEETGPAQDHITPQLRLSFISLLAGKTSAKILQRFAFHSYLDAMFQGWWYCRSYYHLPS